MAYHPTRGQSAIENGISLVPVIDLGSDVYMNAQPLWHPPWGRGIFGGAVIAQSISASQKTVPPTFNIHSIHCYFVLAGESSIPITYHVDRVRDGQNFTMRAVQARQRDKCIFIATLSFTRDNGGRKMAEHVGAMPSGIPIPSDSVDIGQLAKAGQMGKDSPYECIRCPIDNKDRPEERKLRHWIRARGRITGNHDAHVAALAYMSDNYFIGTVARVHNASRFDNQRYIDLNISRARVSEHEKAEMRQYFVDLAREEAAENRGLDYSKHVAMMVSLDHTIFFHDPHSVRADEWMLAEMDSPWAGNERGLVMQRIWSRDGVLLATCFQEGIVRLSQDQLERNKL
ncbi:Thioesterase/thiol ester dehydrase-isomerase [Lepidopterella palustris CBS 459.81]|uniref:Thioesterase/thiol ester dehydrase-isomerase n=1 Tax=Lepidopterella palustris CBS 459.81 TaxID=1314670 RepID=A0A8E2JAZ2_9PEZI|nr:Thioesterase/thiol ester dehydrase-isomerase [Lepidopterella palustris CBS 459.81]